MTVRSLFVGYSGLNGMSKNIDVIGNNIANVNTVGFRAGRATFDDVFYQTLFSGVGATNQRGGINPQQIGSGVQLGSVDTIFTQGSTQSTGRLLDLAINGDGFFVLRNGGGQEFLSRAGNFSLDDEGFLVDPGSGMRLIGLPGDENGVVQDTVPPTDLQIDFDKESFAQQTENVKTGGNFNSQIGQPNGVDVQYALNTSNLLGLFDDKGEAFGLNNGDVIRFDTGFFELADPPNNIQSPMDMSKIDVGKGDGVILSVTPTTTMGDLRTALNQFLARAIGDVDPGSEPGIEVNFSDGKFEFNNFGGNALSGIRVGIQPRRGLETPPEEPNRLVGELFVNSGDPDFSKTLNVKSGEVVNTNAARRADKTSSIDIFDSKGNAHTLSVGMAADTSRPSATQTTFVNELRDSEGRFLIPDGVIPAKPKFTGPVLDSATNTAVFTASQVSNILPTQGVFTWVDDTDNLIALRLTDGAISINGNAFNQPVDANGDVVAEFAGAGIDATGDSFLNIPSAANTGGGWLGDDGFAENTTLEDVRRSIEERINGAIRQVAANLQNVDPNTTTLNGVTAALGTTATIPSVTVSLTEDGSFTFASNGGNLGASASTDDAITQALLTEVGGEHNMGLVLDLAAQTRSVRISTIDPNGTLADTTDDIIDGKVDNDFTDGGGISGFNQSENPFGDLATAFNIGNTDWNDLVEGGDPTANPPTGVDDSGVQLVALSSGVFNNTTNLSDQRFDNYQAFTPEVTAFQALFNKRGFGIAQNFNGTPDIDRPANVPVGVVTHQDDTRPFEINTIKQGGLTRSTVNYQAVVPNDERTVPTNTTGTLIFDSQGRFKEYGNGNSDAPTISFDPDNGDPEGGGVTPLTFKLDMSGITQFDNLHTAQLQGQDGRPVGLLDNVNISQNGEILGIFTNGDTQTLGQILLANVTNEGGLVQAGNTMFTIGPNAGERIFVEAGVDGGTIKSGTLELSNVDLANEFTNLIVAQRAFQANARTVTTADQVLTEIVSLKR